MKQNALDCIGMTPEETGTPLNNLPVAEFEGVAMPLLNSAYNLARWLVQSDHDAEDLVQETYLKAFRSFRSFQPGTNFRAWLYRILRNTFSSWHNHLPAGRMVSLDSDEEGSDLAVEKETPETILIEHVNSLRVQRAIEDLPNIYRVTLLLCDVESMSYREISEIVSIPIGTVMSRLARWRKAVRDSIRGTSNSPIGSSLPVDSHATPAVRM